MKNRVLIVTIFILTLLCCRAKKNYEGKSEYNPIASVSVSMEAEEKKYWDSLCNTQTNQAYQDIKKNRIFYTHLFGMVDEFRSDLEMDSILSKYSIGIKTDGYYCTVPWNQQNCYGKIMEKEIQKRFGVKFIDSIRQVAEKTYVHKHRNDIFKFQHCDMTSRYPGTDDYSEFLENYKNDFFNTFKYPLNFKFKNEKYYSYSNAYFILWRDGRISNLEIESTFQNRENEKYKIEIEEQIRKFVNDTKWKPATALGIPVNSEMELLFHYK